MKRYEVVPFEFEEFPIRVVKDENGDPWFARADVARVLGYKSPEEVGRLLKKHGLNYMVKPHVIPRTGSRGRPVTAVVDEWGLYCLIFMSRTPLSYRFRVAVAKLLVDIRKGNIILVRAQLQEAEAHITWLEAKEDRLELEAEEREQDLRGTIKLLEFYKKKKAA